MIQKVKSISDTVKFVLQQVPDSRDNDRLLMFKVWKKENPALDSNPCVYSFAKDFIAGSYSDPESIRRSRQKIQEQHPELRGRTYGNRKGVQEPEMRREMTKMQS